jgi:hypothetical protein
MRKTLCLLILCALPAVSEASYTCSGTVTGLALNLNGLLTVTVGSLVNVYLCEIGSTYNNVSSDACKAIYAHLLAAKTNGLQEAFSFSDDTAGGNCGTHAAWEALTGWYYGPDFQ